MSNVRHLIHSAAEYAFFRKIPSTNGYEVVVGDERVAEFYGKAGCWIVAGDNGGSHRTTDMAAQSAYARHAASKREVAPEPEPMVRGSDLTEAEKHCADCGCRVAFGDGFLYLPVLCWVCEANRDEPEPELPELPVWITLESDKLARGYRAQGREDHARRVEDSAGTLHFDGPAIIWRTPLLALPAATGTPTERRATLERAFDSNAERLSYDYGAMRVDPATCAIMAALDDAIADQWYETSGWPDHRSVAWSERFAA